MKPIFLMGPTASGKTAAAIELAGHFPVEIISVDSALVFRHMDIGTAKPDREIRSTVRHHLIDIIEPVERYSAGKFQEDAKRLISEIMERGKIPLLVGGTMLYFKALSEGLDELPRADPTVRAQIDDMARKGGWPGVHKALAEIDPETAARLEPTDAQRIQRALEIWMIAGIPMSRLIAQKKQEPRPDFIRIALVPSERSVLHKRIESRFLAMLEHGLIEETEWLRQTFESLDPSMPAMRTVGYRQAWQYLDGEFGRKELIEKGIAATRQLAKRQLTWLRSMEGVQHFDCLDEHVGHHANIFLSRTLGG